MYRPARAIIAANAASVSTCSSVARIAATDRALPARVPPTPPVSTMSAVSSARIRSASAADRPNAPAGIPPAIDFPIVTMSGSRFQARVQPPGPALNVCVSSLISRRAAAPGQLADRVQVAGLGQHDPDVGQGGLHQHHGHVARGELALEAVGRSLNSATRVVSRGSTGAPTLPARERGPVGRRRR